MEASSMPIQTENYIEWFRSAAPYIHAHRGKTFVLHIEDRLLASDVMAHLVHDIALLNSLGVRLVLTYGARQQIEEKLDAGKKDHRIVKGLRLTNQQTLDTVIQVVGALRIRLEAMFTMSMPNSPMEQSRIKVSSGNFVTAKPVGVIDGVDLEFTGNVRRVDSNLIRTNLDNHEIVLISPVGYSLTGEVFNLSSLDIASQVAISLRADKLLFLMYGENFVDADGNLIEQFTSEQAKAMLAKSGNGDSTKCAVLAAGLQGTMNGVGRIHFIDQEKDGSLMLELFSRDGVGTLLTDLPFDEMRTASIDDVGGILELIQPLEEAGYLVRRSREKLEMDINDFTVLIRDGSVIGCAALHLYADESVAELACMVINEDYKNSGRGRDLLQKLEKDARDRGVSRLFVLTTQTIHWFLEQGFSEAEIDDLPMARKEIYNYQRNSRVLVKDLR